MTQEGKEAQGLVSTLAFAGRKVTGGSSGARHIGKVRACLFHPEEKRCIGFLVKRPDAMYMFKRSDLFVALDGYTVDPITEALVVSTSADASGKEALKQLGVSLADCFRWDGAPIECEDGTPVGTVGEVLFDVQSGRVRQVNVSTGTVVGLVKGRKEIDAKLISGLRMFSADEMARIGEKDVCVGTLLVSNEVQNLELRGSAAEQAGKAAGAVADKAKELAQTQGPRVKATAQQVGQSAKETGTQLSELAARGVVAAGKATGAQIGKTRNAIDEFLEEYHKALSGEDESDDER